MTSSPAPPDSVEAVQAMLSAHDYIADRALSTCVFLALRLGRPLFLEGEAGVGKTEIAKVLARALGRPLERLQCYEGLDLSSAAYEWNYARQMIEIRLAEATGNADRERLGQDIFTDAFLIRRPLLRAVEGINGTLPVLLVDELDRADEPFEAFLLEVLSDFTLTIPELGMKGGVQDGGRPPVVVITSNRTREIHDALKRRCLYHWVDYPDTDRERAILRARAPGIGPRLGDQVVAFVQGLRDADLFKLPGVAETLDWANALMQLDVVELDPAVIDDTLGVLLKYQDDILRMRGSEAAQILEQVKTELARGPAS